jgi:hypothetical protein
MGQGGTAGAPVMGEGGGGAGGGGSAGAGPCVNDAACLDDKGTGSLCVANACTTPTSGCTKATLVVVPDPAFTGTLDADLAGACFYRALGPALGAVEASTTTRVVAYAQQLTADAPVRVPTGVRLEGRPQAPSATTRLTVGDTAGKALVTLEAGAGLKGFELGGNNVAAGIVVEGVGAQLEGPLTVRAMTLGLEVVNKASAAVTGTAGEPVLFDQNKRGVVARPAGALTLTGDGATGLVFTGTSAGAAVLVEAGGNSAEVALTGVRLATNTGGDVEGGEGAVEVRPGRKLTLTDNVLENNRAGLRLNGLGTSGASDFVNVTLTGNLFVVGASAGVAICGADLSAGTTLLRLAAGNELPSGVVGTQAQCDVLEAAQLGNCNGGAEPGQRDVGYTTNPLVVQCPTLPLRRTGKALP